MELRENSHFGNGNQSNGLTINNTAVNNIYGPPIRSSLDRQTTHDKKPFSRKYLRIGAVALTIILIVTLVPIGFKVIGPHLHSVA